MLRTLRFDLATLLFWTTFVGLATGIVLEHIHRGDNQYCVQRLACSGDGSIVAALLISEGDAEAIVWDASTGNRLLTRGGLPASGILAVSGEGDYVVFNGADFVELWHLPTRENLGRALPAGQLLAAGGNPCRIVTTSATGVRLFECLDHAVKEWKGLSVASRLAPSDVSASGDVAVVSVDRPGHAEISIVSDDGQVDIDASITPWLSAFTHDGSAVALLGLSLARDVARGKQSRPADPRFMLQLFDVASGQARETAIGVETFPKGSLFFLPGDNTVGYADDDLRLWDATTLAPRAVPDRVGRKLIAAAAAAHRPRLFLARPDEISVWDSDSFVRLATLWRRTEPLVGWPLSASVLVWYAAYCWRSAKAPPHTCRVSGRPEPVLSARCRACRELARFKVSTFDELERRERRRRTIDFACRVVFAAGIAVVLTSRLAPSSTVGPLLGAAIYLGVFSCLLLLPSLVVRSQLALWKLSSRWRARESSDWKLVESAAREVGFVSRRTSLTIWSSSANGWFDFAQEALESGRQRLATATGMEVGQVQPVRVIVFRHTADVERYLTFYGLELWAFFQRGETFYLTNPARILLAEDHWQPQIGLRSALMAHLLSGRLCRSAWLKHGLSLSLAHEEASALARLNRRMLAGLQNRQVPAASKFLRHRVKKFAPIGRLTGDTILIQRKVANWAVQRQFVGQTWSVVEFVCGSGATEERAAAFRSFFQDDDRDLDPERAIERHFGITGDELLSQWRSWVVAQGFGVHGAPQPALAAAVVRGPLAAAMNPKAPLFERIVAIRRLGMLGFAAFADVLIDVARRDDGELRVEAFVALEMISGQTLAAARAERLAEHAPAIDPIEYWESWWASLPESAKRMT